MPTFGIVLEDPQTGAKAFETLQLDGDYTDAHNRARAAHAGERMREGYRAIAVTQRFDVRGRCSACNAVLFADQPAAEGRDGLRCFDCS